MLAAAQAATSNGVGGTTGATLVGGTDAAAPGAMLTQGRAFDNATMASVQPSAVGISNGIDTTATGVAANAGTLKGVNGAAVTTVANGATAYGAQSLAQDTNTTAIGFRSTAMQAGSVAIGYQASALADPSTAVGANSFVAANADNGVAIGASSAVTAVNGTALGFQSQATGSNSVAIGANSVANQANTVSVGAPGSERRITNLAPGVAGTDAVNVNQLGYVNQRVDQLQGNIDRVQSRADAGAAAGIAVGSLPQPFEPGQSMMAAGIGSFGGEGAVAIGYSQRTSDGKWVYKINGTVNSRSKGGVGASAGYAW